MRETPRQFPPGCDTFRLNSALALLGKLFRHAVERRGQLTDLVFGDDLHPCRPVAASDCTRAAPYERVRAGIGYVPQGREIFPRLTVEENLLMGLATRPARTPVPPRIFEMFPVLKTMMRRRGGDLSGGQQQQLAIGRALAMGPRLLILDEPTEGIQPSIIKDIERAIRALAASGDMSILLVEQYYDFARSLAGRHPRLLVTLIMQAQEDGALVNEHPLQLLCFLMASVGLPRLLSSAWQGPPLFDKTVSATLSQIARDRDRIVQRLDWAIRGLTPEGS